jgi:hypothetical protein
MEVLQGLLGEEMGEKVWTNIVRRVRVCEDKSGENFDIASNFGLIYFTYFFFQFVMKVALFYTQNRSESRTFLHEKS